MSSSATEMGLAIDAHVQTHVSFEKRALRPLCGLLGQVRSAPAGPRVLIWWRSTMQTIKGIMVGELCIALPACSCSAPRVRRRWRVADMASNAAGAAAAGDNAGRLRQVAAGAGRDGGRAGLGFRRRVGGRCGLADVARAGQRRHGHAGCSTRCGVVRWVAAHCAARLAPSVSPRSGRLADELCELTAPCARSPGVQTCWCGPSSWRCFSPFRPQSARAVPHRQVGHCAAPSASVRLCPLSVAPVHRTGPMQALCQACNHRALRCILHLSSLQGPVLEDNLRGSYLARVLAGRAPVCSRTEQSVLQRTCV
jgi:hypothetical protein